MLQFNEHKLRNGVAKITPLENTDHSCKTIVITIILLIVHAHEINISATPFEIQMVATWYASSPNFSVSATVESRLRLPRHYDHIFVFKQMEHSVPSFLSQHHQSDHPVLMGTIPVRNNPMEFQVPWNSMPWKLHGVSVNRSSMGRASDRMQKKIGNYAALLSLIMRQERSIVRHIMRFHFSQFNLVLLGLRGAQFIFCCSRSNLSTKEGTNG